MKESYKTKSRFFQIKSIHDIIKFLPIIGIFIYAYIIWKTGISNIIEAFENIQFVWLIPLPFIIIAVILFKGLKWKLILNHYGQDFSYKNACLTWCIGAFVGGLTPGQAGEAIKAVYVRQVNPNKSLSECISTIFSDKILEIFSLMTLVILSSAFFIFRLNGGNLSIVIFFSAFIMLALFYGMTDQRIYILIKKVFRPLVKILIPNNYREKISGILESFLSGIWELKREKRLLTNLWLLAIFTWFFVFLMYHILALSLRLKISPFYMMIISPIITFSSILPISISGVGTRDVSAIFFFNQIGIGTELAIAWSILNLCASWLFSLIGWVVSLKPSFWLGLDKPN